MKFGLMTQIQMPRPWEAGTEPRAYEHALAQAAFAESVGVDYFWITEQHFYIEIGHSSAPDMFLSALSQRTTRLRLGFAVFVLPCHHPFAVAERVATLDVLSNGRAEFGSGRGTASYIVEGFGVDHQEAKAMWDESLQAVCSIFEHERFPGFRGRYYDLPPRQVVPRPVQKPHPPLWVAASNIPTYEQAARKGLGVLGVTRIPPGEVQPAIAAYRSAAKTADPKDFYGRVANTQVGAFAIAYCDKDDAVGRNVACAAARWYYGDNDAELNRLRFGSVTGQQLAGVDGVAQTVKARTNDQLIDDALVIGGNPDTCSRTIERWAEAGLDQLIFFIQAGRMQHDQVLRALDLLGEKVLPRFAGHTQTADQPRDVQTAIEPTLATAM